MTSLSEEYKSEIQEIFGEIYAKYIKEELQATVESEVSTKLKTTADGISRQAEQAIRKEVERLSAKLKKGITDAIKAELLDMIKDAVPKEKKELDYEKLKQMITKILDERKEAETVEALPEIQVPVEEKPTKPAGKAIRGLLIVSLVLNILFLAFWIYRILSESGLPFF
jgi:hypothetical protein